MSDPGIPSDQENPGRTPPRRYRTRSSAALNLDSEAPEDSSSGQMTPLGMSPLGLGPGGDILRTVRAATTRDGGSGKQPLASTTTCRPELLRAVSAFVNDRPGLVHHFEELAQGRNLWLLCSHVGPLPEWLSRPLTTAERNAVLAESSAAFERPKPPPKAPLTTSLAQPLPSASVPGTVTATSSCTPNPAAVIAALSSSVQGTGSQVTVRDQSTVRPLIQSIASSAHNPALVVELPELSEQDQLTRYGFDRNGPSGSTGLRASNYDRKRLGPGPTAR